MRGLLGELQKHMATAQCEGCSKHPILHAGSAAANDATEDLEEGSLLRAAAQAALLSAIPFGIASVGMLVSHLTFAAHQPLLVHLQSHLPAPFHMRPIEGLFRTTAHAALLSAIPSGIASVGMLVSHLTVAAHQPLLLHVQSY